MSLLDYVKARVVEEGDCWIWQQYCRKQPEMNYPGLTRSVRRALWELLNGEVRQRNHVISVSCGDVRCCNPKHLTKVAITTVRKKAAAKRGIDFNIKVALGKRKQAGKMTDAMLHHIRTSNESSQQIAKQYGLAKSTVKNVRNGTTWKDYSFAGLFR